MHTYILGTHAVFQINIQDSVSWMLPAYAAVPRLSRMPFLGFLRFQVIVQR